MIRYEIPANTYVTADNWNTVQLEPSGSGLRQAKPPKMLNKANKNPMLDFMSGFNAIKGNYNAVTEK